MQHGRQDPSIHDFLRSGILGPLRLGVTLKEVNRELGKPSLESISRDPLIWRYDGLELAFFNFKVIAMSLHFSTEYLDLHVPVTLEGWLPCRQTTIGEFETEMAAAGIVIKPNPLLNYPDRLSFVSEAGVSIYFERDGKDSRLESFQLLDPEYGRLRAARRIREIRDTMQGI